jgi:ABC-type phosphate transport system ATPase subunit
MMSISENVSIASRHIDFPTMTLFSIWLIEHGPTETIFTQPKDPRTKACMEDAFG